MTPINNIGNNQQQGVQSWMASCLAMTFLGFVCTCFTMVLLRSFRASLRGGTTKQSRIETQHWVASCLAMTKCVLLIYLFPYSLIKINSKIN